MANNNLLRILLVDDDDTFLEVSKQILLMSEQFAVETALSADEALRVLANATFDVVVSDYDMPGKDGIAFLKELRNSKNDVPFIMFTGKGREEIAIQALNLGANYYLNKHGQPELVYGELVHAIVNAVRPARAERALKESEEKFRVYVENSPAAVFVADLEGKLEYANEAASEMLGYSIAELQRISIPQLTFQEDLPKVDAAVIATIKAKEPFRGELRLKSKSGSAVFVYSSAVKLPSGKLLAFCEDITEQKKIENELGASEKRFRETLDNMMEGCQIIDHNWRYVYINDAAAKQGRFAKEALLGKTMMEMYPGIEKTEMFSKLQKCMKKRVPVVMENEFVFQNDDKGWFQLSMQPVPEGVFILSVDITERKKAEEAIRIAEERYRQLFNTIPSGVAVYKAVDNGADFVFVDFSQGAEKIEKIRKQGLLGKRVTEVFPGVKELGLLKVFQRVFQTGQAESLPSSIYKDKRIAGWRENWVYKLPNGNIVAVYNDVTEKKKAEEALLESERKYRSLFENSLDGVMLTKPDGAILSANPQACRMLGMTEDEVRKAGREGIVVKDKKLAAALKKRERLGRVIAELTFKRKDGTTFVGEVSSVLFTDAEGVTKTSMVIRDVSEQKQVEKSLRKSEQKFREFADSLPEIAFEIDNEGKVTYINEVVSDISGYSKSEVIGRSFLNFVVPEDRARVKENVQKKMQGNQFGGNEYLMLRKDGTTFPVMSYTKRSFDEKGKPILRGLLVDISELKKTTKELATLNEKLSVVGGLTRHDVRNKLTAMAGQVYLLQTKMKGNPDVEACATKFYSIVEQAEKILDFSKAYEKMGMEQLRLINAAEYFDNAATMFPELQNLQVSNELGGLEVMADSLLMQVFYNLIDNSLRHGKGVTRIRASFKEEAKTILLTYEDDGVGIAETEKKKLFSEDQTSNTTRGHGLFLIKNLMNVYNWTINEEGKPGKGVKFTITIPK